MSDNAPKVLIEFTPDEIKWLADHFHDVAMGITGVKASMTPGSEAWVKIEAKQKMAREMMNRALDKASDQGFGVL